MFINIKANGLCMLHQNDTYFSIIINKIYEYETSIIIIMYTMIADSKCGMNYNLKYLILIKMQEITTSKLKSI